MASTLLMEKFNPKYKPDSHETRDSRFPLVENQDYLFLMDKGGSYCGYVNTGSGRMFKEVRAIKQAFFDRFNPGIKEMALEISGGDGVNTEVSSPSEIRGYDVMLTEYDAAGIEIVEPCFIDLYPEMFPGRTMTLLELRNVGSAIQAQVLSSHDTSTFNNLILAIDEILARAGYSAP